MLTSYQKKWLWEREAHITVTSSEFAPRGDVYFLRKTITITPGGTQRLGGILKKKKKRGERSGRASISNARAVRRGRGGKEKEWTDCVQSDIRAFGITGDWETMAVKAEVCVEAVTKGGRRFMAAWRQEEEDAASRRRQEKREATRLGKLQSHTEA